MNFKKWNTQSKGDAVRPNLSLPKITNAVNLNRKIKKEHQHCSSVKSSTVLHMEQILVAVKWDETRPD